MSHQESRSELSSPGELPAWVLRFLALGKMSRDFQAFHQTFFDESKELLDAAFVIVAEGAGASLSREQVAELHRCVHGVAGGAATLGFEQPALLARAIEERLDRYRTGGDGPDAAALGRCQEALGLLGELLARLRAGEALPGNQIEMMIARLQARVEARAEDRSAGDAQDVRSIRFVLSRSLAGADIIIEHVLDDLGRLGNILGVVPPPDQGERSWCIRMAGEAPDSRIADVLEQIAEPGSLQITRAPAAPADAGPLREPEPNRMPSASPGDPGGAALSPIGCSAERVPAADHDSGTPADEHVSFWVGDQMFVIAAPDLLGVEGYRGELRMPGLPAVLLGMLAVNGEPVPLVDARRALHIDEPGVDPDEVAPVLLIETRAGPIGLLADRIGERLRLQRAQLRRPRALQRLIAGSPVTGFFFIGDRVAGFLEPDRLCRYLDGFEVEVSALDAGDTKQSQVPDGRQADRTMMQARPGSAIMTGNTGTHAPVRRVAARPVARRSLEEEWKQRDP